MADYMGRTLGGTGEVGLLVGSLTAPNHIARARGFKEEMAAKYPNVKIVFQRPDNDNLQTAVTLTENALQAHPNLRGIYGVDASAPRRCGPRGRRRRQGRQDRHNRRR